MNNQNMETWRDARPAFLGDVAAAETWLEDWAAKGYRLVGFRGMNGVFVKDELKTCRYRLEPLARKEKPPTRIGWRSTVRWAGCMPPPWGRTFTSGAVTILPLRSWTQIRWYRRRAMAI